MDQYEKVDIPQNRGPRLVFEGKLIASTSFPVPAKGLTIDLEVWETRGGSLVAASFSSFENGDGREFGSATVVEPGPDEDARHFAVMEQFEWSDRARSMVRKQLGWSLKKRVD